MTKSKCYNSLSFFLYCLILVLSICNSLPYNNYTTTYPYHTRVLSSLLTTFSSTRPPRYSTSASIIIYKPENEETRSQMDCGISRTRAPHILNAT